MRDLSFHLLDVLENSATAGACRVTVRLEFSGTWLSLEVTDNGPGMPPEIREDPTDPFRTTRTARRVGLGLGLLRRAAEQTRGSVTIGVAVGGGVCVHASFDLGHLDAKPLGDVEAALLTAIVAWPGMEVVVEVGDDPVPILDTMAIKEELGGVTLDLPAVRDFLRRELHQGLRPVKEWAEQVLACSAARLVASASVGEASAFVYRDGEFSGSGGHRSSLLSASTPKTRE